MSVAAAHAYAFLRSGILSGDLQPGARLLETEIAVQAGVSRTPVREAFRRLDAEGLVHMRPRVGAVVRSWSAEDVADIFSLRALLEARAVERAATRISASQLSEASSLAHEMAALAEKGAMGDRQRIGELNSCFHRLLTDAAASSRLQSMMAQVADIPLSLRTINRYDEAALKRSMQHHLEIVAALKRSDPDWAASVMRSHILAAWRAIAVDVAAHTLKGKR